MNQKKFVISGNGNSYSVMQIGEVDTVFASNLNYQNATRIVACVNACEGFTTASIEDCTRAMGGFAKVDSELVRMRKEHRIMKTQRDELLAALSDALEWIDAVPSDMPLPAMPGFDRDAVNELIAAAKGVV